MSDGAGQPHEVVTAGEPMALLLAEGQRPLRDADRFIRSVAGTESNVAIGLARLGHRVAFTGRIGTDAAGEWVRHALRADGVDTGWLRDDPDHPTGLILRDYPAGRPVSVSYYRTNSAPSALTPEDADPDLIAGCRVLFVTGITAMLSSSAARFVEHAVGLAREAGTHVVFDLNVRLRLGDGPDWRKILHRYAGWADTLLIGQDELEAIGEPADPRDFLTGGTRTVLLKRGAAGATVFAENLMLESPARTVPVVDPVGAGDAFATGWISGLLRALGPAEALREAVLIASLAVAAATDTGGLPTAAERDRLLGAEGADVDR
jgi:2-dehydro-3-deoxygluconokinase